MATYITRIELHNANFKDYTNLHAAMRRQGFAQSITANDGREYILPTAEYFINTPADRSTVYNSAMQAATSTGRAFWIITSETNNSTFELQLV